MVNILNCKELSNKIIEETKNNIDKICTDYNLNTRPGLLVISVGYNEASNIYIKNKQKACEKCNIHLFYQSFNENITKKELLNYIKLANENKDFDGILIQQPLPKHLQGIEQYINPDKDVDGFTKYNLGNTLYNKDFMDEKNLYACTPLGVLKIFEYNNIKLEGLHVVIIGRSVIVGKPLIGLLLQKNATVTTCNSYTKNLKEIVQQGDVIISAIGKPKLIDHTYISEKTKVIIDVGINRDDNNKLCGDINLTDIINNGFNRYYTTYATPVPNGVGPMTVAMLMHNTYIAFKNKIEYNIK